MFGRKKQTNDEGALPDGGVYDTDPRQSTSDRTPTNTDLEPSKSQIKRATRTRLCWSLLAAFFLLISVIFIILVEIGNTKVNHARNRIYFLKLNLTNIIPLSVPDATLINSIAETLGLHDFYTVGLWGFCEGYNSQGVTDCSKPQTLYWFDPVTILESELLAGATIALPAEITQILGLIETVSHWMFGLFLAGVCLDFLMIFLVPLSVFSRWATLPIMIFTFLGALLTTVAAILATALFVIAQDALTSQKTLNIGASIGTEMFAFMWIGAGAAILAWLILLCLSCCCASRRDVRKGKKRGSKKAWRNTKGPSEKEPSKKRGLFGRK
ncbi:SUR7/PalI family [Teratosphaeria destructans]|uniref:SUR7/PalI family n=1 Tax=Teratosphaeria destructans TaxID=418781 RepID=A0A9W7SJX6_9PEZI|nr:SUR7/PalI family [Teratosphaeria destructans]